MHIPLMVAGIFDFIIQRPALLMALSALGAYIFILLCTIDNEASWRPSSWKITDKDRQGLFVSSTGITLGVIGYVIGMILSGG